MKHILITGAPGVGKTTLVTKVVDRLNLGPIDCGGFFTEEVRSNRRRRGFDVVSLDGNRAVLARKRPNRPNRRAWNVSPSSAARNALSAGNDTPALPTGNDTPALATGNDTPALATGNDTPALATGNDTPALTAGNDTPALPAGNDTPAVPTRNDTPDLPVVGQYEVHLEEFESIALPALKKNGSLMIIDEIGKMEMFSEKFQESVKRLMGNKDMRILATVPLNGGPDLVKQLKESGDCEIITVDENNRDYLVDSIIELINKR